MLRKAIGIIPAAGHGTRLHPFRYPKELFPIGYVNGEGSSDLKLKVACQYVLDCLIKAGIYQAHVIVSDHKFEVLRFLADGEEYGLSLSYLYQREIKGLPFAIDCAYNWTKDSLSALVLPDTILEPYDCVYKSLLFLEESQADVVLGVFPTEHPERLCPVHFDKKGNVYKLYDKDASQSIMNTWGIAVWTPNFAEFLHQHVKKSSPLIGKELVLAEVFNEAIVSGLKVNAIEIPKGKFWDIGTSSSLIKVRQAFEKHLS
ncbi:MAG: sugar nucleotidyltransferase [Blastocatellia bacterium]|nr:sugar nucleotidyltransferase [Blastocatellia bacterium]